MKLLLDTHIILWGLLDPTKLSRKVARAIESPANEVWFSPISTWEMLLLIEKGRVAVDGEPAQWIRNVHRTLPLREAPLTLEIALRSRLVKLPHQDPADRFLAATASVHGLTLVTEDARMVKSKACAVLANV